MKVWENTYVTQKYTFPRAVRKFWVQVLPRSTRSVRLKCVLGEDGEPGRNGPSWTLEVLIRSFNFICRVMRTHRRAFKWEKGQGSVAFLLTEPFPNKGGRQVGRLWPRTVARKRVSKESERVAGRIHRTYWRGWVPRRFLIHGVFFSF